MSTHDAPTPGSAREARRAALGRSADALALDRVIARPMPGQPATWRLTLHFVPYVLQPVVVSGDVHWSRTSRLPYENIDRGPAPRPTRPPRPANPRLKQLRAIRVSDLSLEQVGTGAQVPVELGRLVVVSGHRAILAVPMRVDGWLTRGDSAANSLTLRLAATTGVDPFFSAATFSLGPALDVAPFPEKEQAEDLAQPAINYLNRDFEGLRQTMLDRLAQTAPDWQERHPADIGNMVLDLLAYAGDYLSYYEDAVYTESFLPNARQRVSARRHARLLDTRIEEGRNARGFVHVRVLEGSGETVVPRGTMMMTGTGPLPTVIRSASTVPQRLEGVRVVETMNTLVARPEQNVLRLHDWGGTEVSLALGSTRAALRAGPGAVAKGDVLVLCQLGATPEGPLRPEQVSRTWAVRIVSEPEVGEDRLFGVPVLTVEWAEEDALPWPLVLSTRLDGVAHGGLAVALGNVVLVDAGQTVEDTHFAAANGAPGLAPPGTLTPSPDGGLILSRSALVWAEPLRESAADGEAPTSVFALMRNPTWSPLPQVQVEQRVRRVGEADEDTVLTWRARPDLLSSGPDARDFVVEIDNRDRARLRFGDGVNGLPAPDLSSLRVRYRVGAGSSGNIGAGTISHVVGDLPSVVAVTNPAPISGGTPPETLRQLRARAQRVLGEERRCVVAADYQRVAEAQPGVLFASAEERWQGSRYRTVVYVVRKGGLPADASFCARVRSALEAERLAGAVVSVRGPRLVPLDIALRITLRPGARAATVRAALQRTLLRALGPDFDDDALRLRFGQAVYLSALVALAGSVPGVLNAVATRFRRSSGRGVDSLLEGRIPMLASELPIVSNRPQAPEMGVVELTLVATT